MASDHVVYEVRTHFHDFLNAASWHKTGFAPTDRLYGLYGSYLEAAAAMESFTPPVIPSVNLSGYFRHAGPYPRSELHLEIYRLILGETYPNPSLLHIFRAWRMKLDAFGRGFWEPLGEFK